MGWNGMVRDRVQVPVRQSPGFPSGPGVLCTDKVQISKHPLKMQASETFSFGGDDGGVHVSLFASSSMAVACCDLL